MKRLALLLCAIAGHSWIDESFDARPDWPLRWVRCHRCETWTMTEERVG